MVALVDLPVGTLVEPMQPEPYVVIARVVDTVDVVTLTLAPRGRLLADALPGQFVMLWAFGVGEIPISISGVGTNGTIALTVRSVGAVSKAVVRSEPGTLLGLRGPYGTAWPVADAAGRNAIVVAGGLGLAPLRLAIDALATRGPLAPSRLTVVIGSREPAQLFYGIDLQRWTAAGAHVNVTVDAADRAWTGAVGTATALIERLAEPHDLAFVCGPEIMVTTGARALIASGTLADRLFVSLERNMHCGIGHCGRCQLGPHLLCRDGAVVRWPDVAALLEVRGR
jgi:anaerobic sulfite reductase subunit B